MYQPKTESICFFWNLPVVLINKIIRIVYQYQLKSMVKYLSVTVLGYAEK